MEAKINHLRLLKYLFGMVVVGSILGIENSQEFGCIMGLEMLSVGNLIFLLLSSSLLYTAIKSNNSKLAIKVLVLETTIWIVKYILYKGGYITGFGGTANPINVVYDFISIGLRIWILLILTKKIKYKIAISVLTSILLVVLKINLFALPWYTKYMWELEDKQTEQQKIELIGKYTGTIRKLSNNKIEQIELKIDTAKLEFLDGEPFNLEQEYFFNLNYPNIGGIRTDKGMIYDLYIDKLDKDSLIFHLEDMSKKEYLLSLKTKR